MPAPFAADAFTDVDGTLLSVHSPTGGGSWTEIISGGNSIQIYSGVGVTAGGPSTLGYYVHSATPPSANYDVEMLVAPIGTIGEQYVGVLGRIVDNANLYRFFYNPIAGEWQLDCVVANAIATSSTYTQVLTTTSYALKMSLNGSSLKGYVDGVERCSLTDTTYTTAGSVGLLGFNLGFTASYTFVMDDWSATETAFVNTATSDGGILIMQS